MSVASELKVLTRAAAGVGAPSPVRIVHIGLGAFHRSHQAWYTEKADPDGQWGIAAFTGRSPEAASILSSQDGLYTLVERSDSGDTFDVVGSITAAYDGADLARLAQLLEAPETAIVTITVTEAAYNLDADGRLNVTADAVARDAAALSEWWKQEGSLRMTGGNVPSLATMGARVLTGLDARRRARAGPLAVVSCDNLSANGAAASQAILGLAVQISDELAAWVAENVSFVDTSVDRITPRTTDADIRSVQTATGFIDSAPVVTEPFSSWVLSGTFPAGRPSWEDAGAVFVDDIEPFEQRKLWLLNGAHSLLAYAGQLRGFKTVAEAVADNQCSAWLKAFWDEASAHLRSPELEVPAYRSALLERFGNARIEHLLQQIAADGTSKLRMRAVPVLAAERAAGRDGTGAARIIASWIDYVAKSHHDGVTVADSESVRLEGLLKLSGEELTVAMLNFLDAEAAADQFTVALVHGLRGSW